MWQVVIFLFSTGLVGTLLPYCAQFSVPSNHLRHPPLCQVRLLELYDIVDLFVLYEIPYTHMGMEKPLYFNDSLASE